VELNLNDLTIGEVADLEEVLGISMEAAFAADAPRGRVIQALVWINNRREDPTFTFEDAGKLKLSEMNVEQVNEIPPPSAAG